MKLPDGIEVISTTVYEPQSLCSRDCANDCNAINNSIPNVLATEAARRAGGLMIAACPKGNRSDHESGCEARIIRMVLGANGEWQVDETFFARRWGISPDQAENHLMQSSEAALAPPRRRNAPPGA